MVGKTGRPSPVTVFVITAESDEREWIASTLAADVHAVVFVEDNAAWLARLPVSSPACLVMSAEPDVAATLKFVRELRGRDETMPDVVLGSHSAFRAAVDIARLPATDFPERPVSVRQLRLAVGKVLRGLGT